MPRYIALLRGINVGKNNRISMADLRALVEKLGYADVRTHLNSGNVVFTAPEQPNETLAVEIEAAITSTLDLDVPVIVRSSREMREVIANNPFPEHAADHTTLHVTFLAATPDPELVAALADAPRGDDDYQVISTEVYLHYPNRISGAVFMPNGLDKALQVTSTSRNWRTVTALAAMADA